MIKLVIIDFDDTLSMTEEPSFRFENQVLQLMGISPMSREVHRKNWGKALKEAIIERVPGIDSEAFVALFEQKLPQMIEESESHDVISNVNFTALDQMRQEGFKIVILTSRTEAEVTHLIHPDHPLSRYIDGLYHKGNSVYTKPDPRVFDEILERFHVSSVEAVYIGDQPSDGRCAKDAGLYFIAVLESKIRQAVDFDGIPVDYFVHRFSEVPKYIKML